MPEKITFSEIKVQSYAFYFWQLFWNTLYYEKYAPKHPKSDKFKSRKFFLACCPRHLGISIWNRKNFLVRALFWATYSRALLWKPSVWIVSWNSWNGNQLLEKSKFLYKFPDTKILRQTLNLPKLWFTMKFDHHWFKGKACGVIPSNIIIPCLSPLYVGGW